MISLLDVDGVLVQPDKYFKKISERLAQPSANINPAKIEELYQLNKERRGYDDPHTFQQLLLQQGLSELQIRQAYEKTHFSDYLYPGANSLISNLLHLGKVIINTKGSLENQRRKLKESGLLAKLETNHECLEVNYNQFTQNPAQYLEKACSLMLVDPQKGTHLPELLKTISTTLPKEKILLIDDRPPLIIMAAKLAEKENYKVTPIWIKQGPHAEGKILPDYLESVLTYENIGELSKALITFNQETESPTSSLEAKY